MAEDANDTLIRRYADGELSPEERGAFESRLETDPDLAARLAAERRLRERVTAVLRESSGPAPASLVARVRHALAGGGDGADRPAGAARSGRAAARTPADGPTPSHPPSRLRARPRANVFMVVATLALVAAAVLIGIYGPSIDQLGTAPDLVSEAANWASSEHLACAGDASVRAEKLSWQIPDVARRQLAAHLQVPDVIVPLALRKIGYEFVGAGPCMVPSGGLASGHMMFRRAAGSERGPAMLSLFVVRDEGQYDAGRRSGMVRGRWYEADGGPQCHRTIRCATDGTVVYLLVCCDERDLDLAERTISLHIQGVR